MIAMLAFASYQEWHYVFKDWRGEWNKSTDANSVTAIDRG